MTPKEKADELIKKFSGFVTTWNCYYDCPENPDNILKDAKECALIAVDEILSTLGNEVIFVFTDFNWVLYWEQVKKEIEAL
jgi:hypothetical protein